MNENENAVAVRMLQGETLSLKQVTDRVNLIHNVMARVMKDGTHYGIVPGCGKKKVLLKPGADLLAMTFRLVSSYRVEATDLPNGHREFSVTCSMTAPDGTLLGQGVGSASTMEKKYRYRHDEGGNRIENEDIADIFNTVLKIAKKRAHIDATLSVTGAADIFTQDLIPDEDGGGDPPIAEPKKKAGPATVPEGCSVVTGILEDVSDKSGKNKRGEPWTKFGLKVKGEWYGTFDGDLGALAKSLKGNEVSVGWIQDGEYKTVKLIAPAPAATSSAPAPDDRLMAYLAVYENGFPKLFSRGCEHIKIGLAEWKTAPRDALERLGKWLDAESARQ